MFGCVFYADILGFGDLSRAMDAGPARNALLDLSAVVSNNDELGRYLRRDKWLCRYALSDSLFLVSENATEACTAAAEIFFSLAYLNASHEDPILRQSVLLRGGISCGDFQEVAPLFPETSRGNLVGEAVVQAVNLEGTDLKGPRLFVSEELVTSLGNTDREDVAWIVDNTGEGPAELLWPLPPIPSEANGGMIGEVCDAAVRLFALYGSQKKIGLHYAGYLDLVLKSLERLSKKMPREALFAINRAGLDRVKSTRKSNAVKQFFEDRAFERRLDELSNFVNT